MPVAVTPNCVLLPVQIVLIKVEGVSLIIAGAVSIVRVAAAELTEGVQVPDTTHKYW